MKEHGQYKCLDESLGGGTVSMVAKSIELLATLQHHHEHHGVPIELALEDLIKMTAEEQGGLKKVSKRAVITMIKSKKNADMNLLCWKESDGGEVCGMDMKEEFKKSYSKTESVEEEDDVDAAGCCR